ncbi:MAG: PEP-CTERM sorting domain-containing protein [Nitrospirae bacterium]|nr:PEP-CTERM sorting domain-containing protein [Fimbriimonadaceae bacterium]
MKHYARLLALGLGLGVGATGFAQIIPLYSGALNSTPDAQGWLYQNLPAGTAVVTPPGGSGYTTLNTSAAYLPYAGWAAVTPFNLDPAVGFRVRFDFKVLAEDHGASTADHSSPPDGLADRAGLSFIILGSDKKGVELGVWTDEIWGQMDSPMFEHSQTEERGFVDTTGAGTGMAGLNRLDVTVIGGNYSVRFNDNLLYSAATKDYTPFVGAIDPYETPNFLFLGDDTTSASATFQFSYAEVELVPEPATLAALGIGLAALARRRRR